MDFWIRLSFTLFAIVGSLNLLDAAECFSCMSAIYEPSFRTLGHRNIYLKPLIFTDQCEDVGKYGKDIPRKECQSNCVTLIETITWGAGGYGFVRGCYDNIFTNGFKQSGIVKEMRFADYCAVFNLTNILHKAPGNWQEAKVRFCSCKGHICNGSVGSNFVHHHFTSCAFLLTLLFSFLIIFR